MYVIDSVDEWRRQHPVFVCVYYVFTYLYRHEVFFFFFFA